MTVARVSRRLLLGGVLAAGFAASASAQGQGPIKIGELNSYSRMAAFTVPYRAAMQLAVD